MSALEDEVRIRLSFLGSLRRRLDSPGATFALPRPATVRDVVEAIIERHGPSARDLFYNQYGWLDPRVMFVVDGESVVSLKGLETPLTGQEAVEVFLALPMSGG